MKLVFVSNYFNHHQKPFCEEMYQSLGEDFTFISTTSMREERKKLGYAQNDHPSYVLLSYEGEEKAHLAAELIQNADILIAGAAPQSMLKKRIKSGKIVLRYAERPFKKDISFLRKCYHGIKHHLNNYPQKNVYMLCASAYTAKDYAEVGMYRDRTYRWGYFPAVRAYNTEVLFAGKQKNHIMWCGRFLDWKHPDDVLQVAFKLKQDGYDYSLSFVGTGVLEEKLREKCMIQGLSDRVSFLGSMPPEEVRSHMETAGIYLFTSDKQEGWGAVLNESMNSGCAVVAAHAIGSVPFLIKDGESGLVYESGNVDMLYEKVKYLLDYPEEQVRLGTAAYQTMTDLWNARVAAERLMHLAKRILEGERAPRIYEVGPCSKAPVISDKWEG